MDLRSIILALFPAVNPACKRIGLGAQSANWPMPQSTSWPDLFNIPVGTALGIYTLWVLLQDETAKLFA